VSKSKTSRIEPGEFGFQRVAPGGQVGNARGRGDLSRTWRIRCSHPGCDGVLDHGGSAYLDGDILARNAAGNRWRVGRGLKPLCPLHRPAKSIVPADVPAIIPLPPEAFAAAFTGTKTLEPNMPPEAPTIDIRLMVCVTEHLQDYFNKDRGVYLNDWNDERVAKVTGASVAFVIKVRREAFAELAEDPTLTELRRDIEQHMAECKAMVAASDKRADDLRRRFDSYVQSKRSR
jgi:hypothetical protein